MRVAMYYSNNDVRIQDIPKPKIGENEMLVKVFSSGICGSDVMEWYRIKKAPLVLGHEITGEIVELGENVKKYKLGDRVFVSHHVPCNNCDYCLNDHHTACPTLHKTNYDPGGFSEFIRVPEINVERGVFVLPDNMSYDEGVFIEPLACVVRGQKISRMKPNYRVLILGAGVSGLLHLLLARAQGAGKIVVTDINDYRLKIAEKLGADKVINSKNGLDYKSSFDFVIVCTGATQAFEQALNAVDRGGTILFFAPTLPDVKLSVPLNDFWRNEITLVTSYGNSPLDAKVAIELIQSGKVPVKHLITDRLKLDEAVLGFRLVALAKESLKVILKPNE